MAEKVYVTKAQARAATAIVERSAVTGRRVRPGVAKIAAAATGNHIKQGTGSRVRNATISDATSS